MPIYEYQCSNCGKTEEAFQKFSDKPLTTCRHCKGKLKKLISHSAFHLKGSGWYVTDYAGKKAPETSPETKVEASAPESSSAEKPEKKAKAKDSKKAKKAAD
jgi:putative FmdB family regulatory protein